MLWPQGPEHQAALARPWDRARAPALRSAAEQARKSLAFLELCRALRDASLQALVVKGILCRSLYPKPDLRPSADEDLYVRAEEFVPLRDLLLSLGFQPLGDTARETEETAYRDPGSGLYVEVHRHLFPGDAAPTGGSMRPSSPPLTARRKRQWRIRLCGPCALRTICSISSSIAASIFSTPALGAAGL